MDFTNFWFSSGAGGGPVPPDPGEDIGQSLRFRGGQFLLNTSIGVPDNNFTYSVWVKFAVTGNTAGLIGSNTGVNDGYSYHSSGAIRSRTAAGWGTDLSDGFLRDPSAWYHLVFQNNSGTTTLFINGDQQSDTSATFASSDTTIIGAANSNVPDEPLQGYMAEIYMIDGQILAPEAFGRENDDGVWIPREVDFMPAEMRNSDFLFADMSGGATPDLTVTDQAPINEASDSNVVNAFDGNTATRAYINDGANNWLIWNPDQSFELGTGLRIFTQGDSVGALWVNNAAVANITGDPQWYTIALPAETTEITSIALRGTAAASAPLNAIEIDGNLITNPFMWSGNLFTAPSNAAIPVDPTDQDFNTDAGFSQTDAFNGDNSNGALSDAGGGSWIQFRPEDEITATTSVSIRCQTVQTIAVNGTDTTLAQTADSLQTVDISAQLTFPIDIETISIRGNGGNNPRLCTIIVDGQELTNGVNSSYGPNGFHLTFADPRNIGADSSGNENNFTNHGFNFDPVGVFSAQLEPGTGGFSGVLPATNAFDGNVNTVAATVDNTTLTFSPTNPIAFTQLEATGTMNGGTYEWNGNSVAPGANNAFVTVFDGAGEISADTPLVAEWPGNAADLAAVRINGTIILVDNTGVDYDQMQDSPTQNWSTLNPLAVSNPDEGKEYGNANLNLIAPNLPMFASTLAMPDGTGIYYWELQNQDATGGIGVCSINSRLRDFDIPDENTLITDNGTVVLNGTVNSNSWNNADFGGGLNQVYGCQYDSNTRRVRFYLNGQQPTFTNVVPVGDNEFDVPAEWGDIYAIGTAAAAAGFVNINYGQQDGFLFPPAGTVALQTQNLPAADIPNGRNNFGILLYNGNGAGQTLGTDFVPGLIWFKTTTADNNHLLVDSVRGGDRGLFCNEVDGQTTSNQYVTDFDDDGSIVTGNATEINDDTQQQVAWYWRAGGDAEANNDGSIQSQISANPDAGFSIVSYTGTGTQQTVGHGLGRVPEFIISKRLDDESDWQCYHIGIEGNPTNDVIYLNLTDEANTGNNNVYVTTPTTEVFTIGTADSFNVDGADYIAYVWAPIPGYSAFGRYVGNGSPDDGPFIYLGFRPAFILQKAINADRSWQIFDSRRNPVNNDNLCALTPNSNASETGNCGYNFDLLSNGFKIRNNEAWINASGTDYLYVAFAENPTGGENVSPANAR